MTSSSQPDPSDKRHDALIGFAARSRNAGRQGDLDLAAAEAISALEDAGIEVLLLKGAALAQALYAPDRERGYYDIDLLVAPEHRATTGKILALLGYRNITSDHQGIDDVAGVVHAELWTRVIATGNISIDLHWKLAGCHAAEQRIWECLRADAQVISLHERPVLTLSDSGLALHAALHVAQHGASDVKAVGDLRLGLRRWPFEVWQAAARLGRQLDGFEAFSAGMRLVPEAEPIAVMLDLESGERVIWDLQHRGSRPRGTLHIAALAEAATGRERLHIVRRALLPSPTWIRWEMSWADRSIAHLGAGYLLHLLRAPSWAVRAATYRSRRPH